MAKRRPYSKRIHGKVSDTNVDYALGDEVKHGWMLYVTTGSVEDEDNAPTTLAFGSFKDENFTPMEEHYSPRAGIRYSIKKTHHFMPGEQPAFRVEGATDGDDIEGYLEGYLEEIE